MLALVPNIIVGLYGLAVTLFLAFEFVYSVSRPSITLKEALVILFFFTFCVICGGMTMSSFHEIRKSFKAFKTEQPERTGKKSGF